MGRGRRRGSSGIGGVMGDRGRRRWSEGAGVSSAMYLARRFFNGTLTSAISRHERVRQAVTKTDRQTDTSHPHTGGEGVGCRSAAGALLGGC